jgi:hypothetical protein
MSLMYKVGQHTAQMQKQSIVSMLGPGVGALAGMGMAPKGYAAQGAGRGALTGAGVEGGATLGAMGGAGLGALGGGAIGAGAGGIGGLVLAALMARQGKPLNQNQLQDMLTGLTATGGVGGVLGGGALGGLAGGIGGGVGGYKGVQHLLGKPQWEQDEEKVSMHKQAILGTAIGAYAGSYGAPTGNKYEGARRGAVTGLGVDVGSSLGGMAGHYGLPALLGLMSKRFPGLKRLLGTPGGGLFSPAQHVGSIAGQAAGGIGGGVGAHKLQGKPSWQQQPLPR